WATATVHHHSIRFKMNNKKHVVNLEYFREMLHRCPRIPNQPFDELPFEEEILAFLRNLDHNDDDDVRRSEHDEDIDDQGDDESHNDQEDDDEQDDEDNDQTDSDNDGDDFIHPKFFTHDKEAKDEESFGPIVQTPSHVENSDDEGNDDASHGINVGGDEGPDAEDDDNELYGDLNINLEGRDVKMTNVHTTQVLEDTHVTLTPVNPDGIDSLFESTPRVDIPVTTIVEPLLLTAPTLPPPSIPIISQRTREGKEPESTNAPKEKASKTSSKSTEGSKSHQKTASESAPAEEPMQTTKDLEEPAHLEFETGAADDQPVVEASQHPDWFL
nr:hypothetical protein [Tanacetum cinerariifolium]